MTHNNRSTVESYSAVDILLIRFLFINMVDFEKEEKQSYRNHQKILQPSGGLHEK